MTREELIVLIARVMEPNRIEVSSGHEDCYICLDARSEILERAKDALLAIEASGLAIVPVEITEEMETAAQAVLSSAVGFTDYGGWTGVCRDQDTDSGQQVLSAMLSANPLKP